MEVGQLYNNSVKVLLVGSGQLGSRHLQGILKNEYVSEIYVVDPWESSLELARKRSQEIIHDKQIHYSLDYKNIPQYLDVCVIAGTANVRLSQLRQVLDTCEVKFLFLEKILYNSLEDFSIANELISGFTGMNVWVNHPRRMYRFYSSVKKILDISDHAAMSVNVSGGNWGLACNGLHFIDLWSYLRGTEPLDVDFMSSPLVIVESKRNDFIEFIGRSTIMFKNGDVMVLESLNSDFTGIQINFSNSQASFEIFERDELTLRDTFQDKIILVEMPQYQSDLTNEMITEIMAESNSSLTPYPVAHRCHQLFVESALKLYNIESGRVCNNIPIT
jgi:hypothetical protein